ncbi:MAG TPA: ribosome biogenesis GTPase Der [Actinomycetota bacterium]|nr:ribosome biogenesis GTPase Der [Actinomycetota bacterium]
MTLPVVAIVGRPNVGKSTLVNRLLGRREAIVQQRPGVTRDRVLYHAEWQGRPFLLVDTGGLELSPEGELAGKVAETARAAAAEADRILFVVDATVGPTPDDEDVAGVIRKLGRPVVLVANKADNASREPAAADFYRLGLGAPQPVSALHGRNTGDLLDLITKDFGREAPEEGAEPRVALVGRPNVGKSSLFNRIVGAQRSIVHDEPGTTRDTVDTVVSVEGGEPLRFVDTAGLRRLMRIDDQTEYYGFVRTMRALDRCELALLVIDGSEGIARQDLRIAEQIVELGRSAVMLVNKVDLLEPRVREIEMQEVRRRLPYLDFAPLIATSAETGEGLADVIPSILRILKARTLRVPTPLLNAVIEDLQARTPIPSKRGNSRVKYAVQAEASPPTIVLFGAQDVPPAWLRHLDRGLRRRFGFEGTPIRFRTKAGATRRTGGKQGRR